MSYVELLLGSAADFASNAWDTMASWAEAMGETLAALVAGLLTIAMALTLGPLLLQALAVSIVALLGAPAWFLAAVLLGL